MAGEPGERRGAHGSAGTSGEGAQPRCQGWGAGGAAQGQSWSRGGAAEVVVPARAVAAPQVMQGTGQGGVLHPKLYRVLQCVFGGACVLNPR